ncbi:MAG: hypothetical protein RBT75_03305 [Anaerolineae bacterium]|jgi:predicted DNA-binding antitoxin AbrB/MazE fold protein|nr:hypothetical protein [Anaerolineae bacterium]
MSDGVQFQDFNFKLAVIERLMYEQGVLKPPFDVYEFVEGYAARKIDIEEEGYDIIPEVRAYFEQLEIPAELLPLIEEINMDGGDIIYGQLYPFWDGEDDVFNIQSAEDAALLPNLKSVTLFYDQDRRILEEFQRRGIAAQWL